MAPGTVVALTVSKGPEPVTVPGVVGETQSAASVLITGAGLTVGAITEEYSSTVPAGNVIRQTPVAGVQALPDSEVSLVVSLGPEMATVPNVVGQTPTEADAALSAVGLAVGDVTLEASNTVPPGHIIRQSPAAGTQAVTGTAVNLVVSEAAGTVLVPSLVGQSLADAEAALSSAGLAAGGVTEEYSNTVTAGHVVSQTPAGGEQVPPGTVVDLVVSKGPQPVTVPSVVGETQPAASVLITGTGLTVGAIT